VHLPAGLPRVPLRTREARPGADPEPDPADRPGGPEQPAVAVGPVAGCRAERGGLRVDLPVVGPSNRFLVPQRDRRWPHVLSSFLFLAVLVVGTLGLVGWPRLKSTSIHYELIGLRAQVRELEQRERQLMLELEGERNPQRLAQRAHALGLVPSAPAGLPATNVSEVVQ